MKQGVQNVLINDREYRIIFIRCENNEIFKENKMTETKQARVLEALQSGEQLTAKQISGLGKPSRAIVAAGYRAMALGIV